MPDPLSVPPQLMTSGKDVVTDGKAFTETTGAAASTVVLACTPPRDCSFPALSFARAVKLYFCKCWPPSKVDSVLVT